MVCGGFGGPPGGRTVTTTHGGYTLLLGNNRDYYEFLQTAGQGSVWSSAVLDKEVGARKFANFKYGPGENPELTGDQKDYEVAKAAIREQPGMFLYASLLRVSRLWGVLPQQVEGAKRSNALRYATAAWYLAEFALMAAGLAVLRTRLLRSPWLWAALLAATFTAVHAVYWTDMRMRAPLVPFIALVAACGAAALGDRIRRRKS